MTTTANVSSHHGLQEPQENDYRGQTIQNRPARGISYFTPAQDPISGSAVDPSNAPKVFQPLTIRGLTFQNRIFLSPLCQYSSDNGHHTMWHHAWLGGVLIRGPGLTMIEATAVQPRGRITPEDAGIWQDSQIEPFRRTVEFAHSQSQKIGIQLAHAGRKASTVAPWLHSGAVASKVVGGWPEDVVGASPIPWNGNHAPVKELTLDDIEELKKDWVAAVKRAVRAGFDVIEIHNAHGYLLHSFVSPISNKRTDQYGGSFENRTRLTREIVQLTREAIPDDMPLFFRISATDWLEESLADQESWRVSDTVRLAQDLAPLGVDFFDVSSGGNHPKQHPHAGPAYQAPFAKEVKKALGDKLFVGTVGSITSGELAKKQVDEGLDAVFVGRLFQKEPGLVWKFADELGVEIHNAGQIRWAFGGRGKKK